MQVTDWAFGATRDFCYGSARLSCVKWSVCCAVGLIGLVFSLAVSPDVAAAPSGRARLESLFRLGGPEYHADTARCDWLRQQARGLDVQLGLRREQPSRLRLEVDGRLWGTLPGATHVALRQANGEMAALWLTASARARLALRGKLPKVGQQVALFLEQEQEQVAVFCGRVAEATVSEHSGLALVAYAPGPGGGERTRLWTEMRPEEIVSAIAQEHGLSVELTQGDLPVITVRQQKEPDWDFLRRLAATWNHSLVLREGRLHFSRGGYVRTVPQHARKDFRDMTYVDVVQSIAAELGLTAEVDVPTQPVEAIIRQRRRSELVFLRDAGVGRGLDFRLLSGRRARVTVGQQLSAPPADVLLYEFSLTSASPGYAETSATSAGGAARLVRAQVAPQSSGLGQAPPPLFSLRSALPTTRGVSAALARVISLARADSPGDPATEFLAAEAERQRQTLIHAFSLNPQGLARLEALASSEPVVPASKPSTRHTAPPYGAAGNPVQPAHDATGNNKAKPVTRRK